jgi:uncharacterized membrane protein
MIQTRVVAVLLAAMIAPATASAAPSVSESRESRQPAVERVTQELVDYGARNAFAYVSDAGHEYSASATAVRSKSLHAQDRGLAKLRGLVRPLPS